MGEMKFSTLIGRKFLLKCFIVDSAHTYLSFNLISKSTDPNKK
jgi:hypothetical protein